MSSWQRLAEDVWYRRQSFGDMQWTPDKNLIHNNIVVACPRGGPIAVVRDERVFQQMKTTRPHLEIFSAFGKPIKSMTWPYQGLVGMYWTPDEVLVAVFEDSVVRTFNILCEPLATFTCDDRAKSELIHLVAFWPGGICLLTRANKVFVNFSFSKQKCIKFHDIPAMSKAPLGMCVVPQDEIDVIALFGCQDGTYVVSRESCNPMIMEDGPYSSFAVSSSGDMIACLSDKGAFKVYDKSLQCLDSASFDWRLRPKQMVWCGDDCVCVYFTIKTPAESWQHLLFVGGPNNEWIPYQYDEQLILVQELDGTRIIGAKAEFLHRVPPSTESIFSIGSCEPPAMLCYALERYNEGDVRAEESLRAIRDQNQLLEAWATVIDATAYELDVTECQRLFKAAGFGRTFMEDPPSTITSHKNVRTTPVAERYTAHHSVNSAKNLRIAHALRGVHLPMTVAQLESISMDGICDRLCIRNEHFLASRIFDWLCIPRDRVLQHWAKVKIRTSGGIPDNQLCIKIVDKFFHARHGASGVENTKPKGMLSFASVAETAAENHRPTLATKLLNHEVQGQAQVNTLIKLGELAIAVEKSSSHGDPDLLHRCFNAMDEVTPEMLTTKVAQNLHMSHFRAQKDYTRQQTFAEKLGLPIGDILVMRVYQHADVETRKEWLNYAAGEFAREKNGQFAAAQTKEQIELVTVQQELEKKSLLNHWQGGPHRFVGQSLMQTVTSLIHINESMEADSLRTRFKIPDKRYWQRKLDALAEVRNVNEIELMAQRKMSPIGYEPFVHALVQCGNIEAAKKVIPSVKDSEAQAKLYESMGLTEEARAARSVTGAGLLNLFKFGSSS